MRAERKRELFSALVAAEEAFEKHLSEEFDVDPAYYDLRLTGYILDTYEFEPLESINIPATFESQELRSVMQGEAT